MGIQSSLERAWGDSSLLRRGIEELLVAALEDRPTPGHAPQPLEFEERAREMQMLVERLESQLTEACTRARKPLDEGFMRQHLGDSSYLFSELFALYVNAQSDVGNMRTGSTEEGKAAAEWRLWIGVLNTDLARCLPLLQQCARGLFECWAELAERMSPLPSLILRDEAGRV